MGLSWPRRKANLGSEQVQVSVLFSSWEVCTNTILSAALITFDDLYVPPENLVGAEGQGYKIAIQILNEGKNLIHSASTSVM